MNNAIKKPRLRFVVCLALLSALPVLLAQQAPRPAEVKRALGELPNSLEELLVRALRTNPDILLAEAKVRQAEAALNQARLKVMQDVAALFYQRSNVKQAATQLDLRAKAIQQRVLAGTDTEDSLAEARLALADAEAKGAQIDAQLRYTLGLGGGTRPVASTPQGAGQPKVAQRPAIPDKFRKQLDGRSTHIVFDKAPLDKVLASIQEHSKLTFVYDSDIVLSQVNVSVNLENVSIDQALLAIADSTGPDLCFVFRDYGVLVTHREHARYLQGATIPSDVELAERRTSK